MDIQVTKLFTTFLLFLVTALMEILGCYFPYLILNQGRSHWLWIPTASHRHCAWTTGVGSRITASGSASSTRAIRVRRRPPGGPTVPRACRCPGGWMKRLPAQPSCAAPPRSPSAPAVATPKSSEPGFHDVRDLPQGYPRLWIRTSLHPCGRARQQAVL